MDQAVGIRGWHMMIIMTFWSVGRKGREVCGVWGGGERSSRPASLPSPAGLQVDDDLHHVSSSCCPMGCAGKGPIVVSHGSISTLKLRCARQPSCSRLAPSPSTLATCATGCRRGPQGTAQEKEGLLVAVPAEGAPADSSSAGALAAGDSSSALP